MPQGDRTGPEGRGSRTGRGLGYCSGYDSPGFARGMPADRRGFGRGLGRGFGYGYRYRQPTRTEQKEMLAEEKDVVKQEIKDLKTHLKDLEEELKKMKWVYELILWKLLYLPIKED